MRDRVAGVARDVQRDVADQPDPALVRIALEGQPLTLETRLGTPLVLARKRDPLLEPLALRRPDRTLPAVVAGRVRRSQQPFVAGECRARRIRRAERIRNVQRQQLPPRLTG